MHSDTLEQVREAIGPEHFSALRSSRAINHDGQLVEWVDVVYSGLTNGPDVTVMNRVIEIFWEALQGTDILPVVNFISFEEGDRLEAAE